MNELTRTPETVGAEIRGLTAQAKQMTLWFGIEIGRRLCEVKEMIGHGEWLPYLKAQTEFSQSTASRFMTLYREYGAQQQTLFGAESNYPTLNNLSISNALRLLALPESERESFAEEHDVEHMSARELDELIQAKKAAEAERDLYEQKLAEQMGAAERLKKDAETAAQEAEARRRELEETQTQIRALQEDIRTLESLAKLFSVMLELGEAEHQIALRKQAEFRALQSQINPHFLFNALNTISGLCLTDPDRARKTILVLAAYFRQTLTINEPFVTLEQEVSNVDNYLMLTEARFEGALHVKCSLHDDLTKLRLPPLILQPIVENAVRHGFVSVDDRRVDICIRQDDERAYIRVSDQGHGFPPEVLRKLEDPNDPTYTGLFNVRKRLRSIYGEQCSFTIGSSERGSTVAFSIPLIPPQMPDTV